MDVILTEFLLARIAEDEAGVRDGMPERLADFGTSKQWHFDSEYQDVTMECGRALAECEAKRQIVEYHSEYIDPQHGPTGEAVIVGHDGPNCPCLCALAAVYSDHADYDPAWKVEP